MESQYSFSCLRAASDVVGSRLEYSYNYGKLRPDQSRSNLPAPHLTAEVAKSNFSLPFVVLSQFRKVAFVDQELPQVGPRSTLLYVALVHKLASDAGLLSQQGYALLPFA